MAMLDCMTAHQHFIEFLTQRGVEGGILVTYDRDKDKHNVYVTIVIEKQSLFFRWFKWKKVKEAFIERTPKTFVFRFGQFI